MSPENSKPEWFQMAEADAIPAAPKSKRGIRLMALATPLLVLGAGLAYAQTQGTSPADAGTTAQAAANPIAIVATPTVATPTTPVASTPSTPESSAPKTLSHESSSTTPTTVLVSQTTSTPTPLSPTAPVAPSPTITKPALTMPTSGGEDDGQERSSDDD